MSFDDFAAQENIAIYYMSLPAGVNGLTFPCGAGYAVVVEKSLNEDARRETVGHELQHILNGHLYQPDSDQAESEIVEDYPFDFD